MGKPLIPWQRAAVDVALELNPDGSWAYTIVIVSVQRQAGKTTMFGPVAHERAAVDRDAKCWWTAQTRQDARDSWMDMWDQVKRSPLGSAAKVRESNGSEAVSYPSGGSFRVFAPTEDALHGKANALVAIDEAWAFDLVAGEALDQAILPTFTTTGGQLWIISTAGTAASLWLLDYIERGRAAVAAGRRDTVCLIEYGVPADTAARVDEAMTRYKEAETVATPATPVPAEIESAYEAALAELLEHHPAAPRYGGYLRVPALRQAAEKMTPAAFLRAYGNHWTGATDQVIPAHAYAATRVPATAWPAPDAGSVTLSIDVAIDGESGSINATWRPDPTGPVYLDVVDERPGTDWMAARVVELRDRWRVTGPVAHDSSGPVLDVADQVRRLIGADQVRALTMREYLTACSGLLAAFRSGDVRHCGRPALDAAVAAAAKRPVGDGGWAFGRVLSPASIAPLVAAAVGRFAHLNAPPPPVKPAVVVATRNPARSPAATRRRARDANKRGRDTGTRRISS